MDSLKELTDFLKKQDNGTSLGELKNTFGNEDQIRHFVKLGLENDLIFMTGKKRGTRYYAKGKVPNNNISNNTENNKTSKKENKKKDEETVYVPDFDVTTNVNVFLQSDKPIPGQGVVTDVTTFGEKDTENIKKFLSAGTLIKTTYISWNKNLKRNVITEVSEHKIYNKIGVKCEDSHNFIFEKIHSKNGNKEQKLFKDYEEFREYLRANL